MLDQAISESVKIIAQRFSKKDIHEIFSIVEQGLVEKGADPKKAKAICDKYQTWAAASSA